MATSLVQRRTALRPPWSAGTLLLPYVWLLRFCWRKELAALDAEQMRDCGLDPREVYREMSKPFWRE